MKKLILILFFLISCSPDFSELTFSDLTFLENELKIIEILEGNDDDIVNKVVATNDGGFIIVGNTKSTNGHYQSKEREGNDIFLSKFNAEGIIEWMKIYGGSDDDIGNDVIESLDGSFYIIGYSKSNDGDASFNKGQHDNWLIKTDFLGNLIWEKSYGFSGHDHAYNIIKTNDGGIFFNGFIDITASEGEGSSLRHGVGEFWCHKVNMNGEIIWRRFFGGSNNDRSYDAIETLDGGFILVGTSESQDFEITNPNGSYDMWIVKISSNGELIWEKSIGGSAIDEGITIFKTEDNNYMILGNTNSSKIEGTEIQGMNDYLFIKIDSDGNIIFKFRHGTQNFDYAKDMIQSKDGSYFVVGYSRNPENIQGINLQNNSVFLSQAQSNGVIQKTWALSGANEDLGYSVCQLKNGKLVIVGSTESTDHDYSRVAHFESQSNYSNKDIFIAILNK